MSSAASGRIAQQLRFCSSQFISSRLKQCVHLNSNHREREGERAAGLHTSQEDVPEVQTDGPINRYWGKMEDGWSRWVCESAARLIRPRSRRARFDKMQLKRAASLSNSAPGGAHWMDGRVEEGGG